MTAIVHPWLPANTTAEHLDTVRVSIPHYIYQIIYKADVVFSDFAAELKSETILSVQLVNVLIMTIYYLSQVFQHSGSFLYYI